MLSRKALRQLLLYLASLALIITALAIIVAFQSGVSKTGSVNNPPPDRQQLFKEQLENSLRGFDSGVLAYSRIGQLTTATQGQLTVKITDIGRHPHPARLLAGFPGWTVDSQDVPTGGIIGVTAFCAGLQCTAESPTRQAVLAKANPGSWTWTLSPLNPGTASIMLVVTTYSRNTNIAVHVTGPLQITIPVRATAGFRLRDLLGTAAGLLRWIGPALLVAGAASLWRYRRNRRNRAANTPETTPQGQPASTPTERPAPHP